MKKLSLLPRVLLVFLSVSGVASCAENDSKASAKQDGQRPVSGAITTVSGLEMVLNSEYSARRFYTGRVEAARRSDLGFELGGSLQRIAVEEGAYVTAGDVLATLDDQRIRARRREAEASVAQADAQKRLTQSSLARLEEARSFDGVSVQQYDEAVNAAASADASLLAAQARLRSVDVDLAKTRLLAPYDAVVLSRHFDEGQVLGPGQAVLSIQESGRLEVRIGLVGEAASDLEEGGRYPLLIHDQPVYATLRAVVPLRDAVTRTVDAVFELSAEAGSASGAPSTRAGDLAQLEVRRTIEAEGYWVPLTALAEGERGLWNAYVLVRSSPAGSGDYIVESRAVEVLYQDGSRAYINGALKPGEQLVPSGLNRVVPGQRVRLQANGV